ncbi:MAG: hypothetical protein RR359_04805 [Bacilli bacterium]
MDIIELKKIDEKINFIMIEMKGMILSDLNYEFKYSVSDEMKMFKLNSIYTSECDKCMVTINISYEDNYLKNENNISVKILEFNYVNGRENEIVFDTIENLIDFIIEMY